MTVPYSGLFLVGTIKDNPAISISSSSAGLVWRRGANVRTRVWTLDALWLGDKPSARAVQHRPGREVSRHPPYEVLADQEVMKGSIPELQVLGRIRLDVLRELAPCVGQRLVAPPLSGPDIVVPSADWW